MADYYVFHRTVRGYSHKKRNISCEDASACYAGEEGRGKYYIAAVADGHGDRACVRSAKGAGLAVKAAVCCLKSFAESALSGQAAEGESEKKPMHPAEGKTVSEEQLPAKEEAEVNAVHTVEGESVDIEKLTAEGDGSEDIRCLIDGLVAQWNDEVQRHIQEHPFLEEELAEAGRVADSYRAGKKLVHAYGTTLIAARMLPGVLLLLQQGDGRCEVFYEDGTSEQPIPWDDRCYQNVTTSMCDLDAADGIRVCVIPLNQKKVTACYLGTDGVEDSYRTMEGTHMFYRKLSCELVQNQPDGSRRNEDVFQKKLYRTLKDLSRHGSGDDVSAAGIVNHGSLMPCMSLFEKQIYRYGLEEERIYYENRRISMSRKHGILRAQMEEAAENQRVKDRELEMARQKYEAAKKEFEKYDARFQEVQSEIRRTSELLSELD